MFDFGLPPPDVLLSPVVLRLRERYIKKPSASIAQTPSVTPTPIPALAPDDRVPCSPEGEVVTLGVGPAMDVLLDVSIDELALVVDASVTLEENSEPLNIAMIGLAAKYPVYKKIVSVTSEIVEVLIVIPEVTVDPAVVIIIDVSDIAGAVVL